MSQLIKGIDNDVWMGIGVWACVVGFAMWSVPPRSDTTYSVVAALDMRNSGRPSGLLVDCTLEATSAEGALAQATAFVDREEPDFIMDPKHTHVSKKRRKADSGCRVREDRD
jgi:hypothetical protein